MADIFLSYANEDREAALKISRLLESAGWTVWWDRRIPAGRSWRSVLEEALGQMRGMVVLWSKRSIESDWVKEEAEEARELGKLVPVLIESVKPPVGFRAIQAADLTDWDGSSDAAGAQQLIADLESLVGKPGKKTLARESEQRTVTSAKTKVGTPVDADVSSNATDSPLSTAETNLWERTERSSWSSFKPGLISKSLIGAGSLIALLLGLFLFWPNPQDQNMEKPPTESKELPKRPPAPNLVNLALNADRKEIKANEGLSLTLRGEYSDGTRNEIKDGIEWTSSDPRVATVDAEGQVKGLQAGRTKITGRYGGLVTPPWTLAVGATETATKPPPATNLVALRINATKKELTTNERMSLQLKGNYSDGSEKALSQGVVWQSSDPAIARVNSKGEVQGVRAGQVEVIARAGGLKSSAVYVVVKAPSIGVPAEASAQKTSGASEVRLPPTSEQLRLRATPYINRAKDHRVQGNYAAALAELDKAQGIDPSSSEIRKEIEQTKRACNAEKRLGRPGLDC